MNGDISRIPIQTLGAVISVTDTLQDLPLPSAINLIPRPDSLLSDCHSILDNSYFENFYDESIKIGITQALLHTDTNNIEYHDNYRAQPSELNNLPIQLKDVVESNRQSFVSKNGFAELLGANRFEFQNDANESRNISDSCDSISKRKKKKKKKKKRKHKEAHLLESSESDSNAASPLNADEPHISYLKLDEGDKKISLKISLKKSAKDDEERKEKKKKRHKNRIKVESLSNFPENASEPVSNDSDRKPDITRLEATFQNNNMDYSLPNDLPPFLNNNNGPINNYDHSMIDQFLDSTDLQMMDDYFKKELAHHFPPEPAHNQSSSYMLSDILGSKTPDFDISSLSEIPTAPTGLAGYLSNNVPKSRGKPNSIRSNAPLPTARRNKRRRNEIEELQKWTVKYPEGAAMAETGSKSSWERALGSYSQALGEKAKRRKRMSRHPQTSNSSYVFEGDEEYPGEENNDSDYEPDSDVGDESVNIHNGIRSKSNRTSESLNGKIGGTRGNSRYRSYVGMAADGSEDDNEEFAAGNSKRKAREEDAPFEVRLKDSVEQRFPHLMQKSSEKAKRRERVGFHASMGFENYESQPKHHRFDEETATESSIETSLARFTVRLDSLFESIEELDLLKCLNGTNDDDGFEAGPILVNDTESQVSRTKPSSSFRLPPEAAISLSDLSELCRHAAKLKATKVTNRIQSDKLVKLLTLLLLNLRDGAGVVPTLKMDEEEDDEKGSKLWRELAMERVMRSVQSGLIGLHLMTSADMPREVYLEDFIQSTVQIVRFQLFNCIYTEYDPAYRTDNSGKENQSSIKSRRARLKESQKSRQVIQLYHRLVECVSGLAELVEIQRLTDGIVLSLSSIGVSIFFVENVPELQLAALKLVTGLFATYVAHRKLIIEDILASLARLPSSKRNLRSYRLNSEDSIQMLTALALMLVQSVIVLPNSNVVDDQKKNDEINGERKVRQGTSETVSLDDEMNIISSYQNAMRTAHMFLSAFLKKSTMKGEDDYRIIFENFVNDLLLTVNKPEWPAAEVMLSLLGSLLVQQFNNKTLDQPTRVASVDYLGTVASTLRRDAVNSQLRERDIDNILRELLEGSDEEEIEENGEATVEFNENGQYISQEKKNMKNELRSQCHALISKLDRIQALRDAIIDYLFVENEDPTAIYARRFYLGQWLSDCTKEGEKSKQQKKNDEHDEDSSIIRASKKEADALDFAERRRVYMLDKSAESYDTWRSKRRQRWNPLISTSHVFKKKNGEQMFGIVFRGQLDYEEACMVCRYLASMRPFSQSFDIYLLQICKLLSETSVPVRTKALRCLSAVVEADPDVLARKDIQTAVHSRLLDSSTSVREAAVDLLGRFLGCKPELISRYYPMLAERILDKGVSVRKRVIRILRDICLEQPDFPRIPEICIKMIRRVNDEEGIKKLVYEVFQVMWFTPVRERESLRLLRKVMNITEVVAACRKTGYEWFEQFLCNLLKKEEYEKVRPVEKACKQIVESLVENVMRLEEVTIPSEGSDNQPGSRLLACIATLHLFTKIRPELMVQHTLMLQPYLAITCKNNNDHHIIHHVARILEVTVPLLEHPSPNMIARLETDIVTLTLKYGKMVLESCIACLGSVVNKVSKNYSLAKDCFYRFFSTLTKCKNELQADPSRPIPAQTRPLLLRALFTVGLLCKHFDSSVFQQVANQNVRDQVFEVLMFFVEKVINDIEIRKNALSGLGFLCTRHHELLCGSRLCKFYQQLLQFPCPPPAFSKVFKSPSSQDTSKSFVDDNAMLTLKSMVLENLLTFFLDEEKRMLDADSKWKKVHNAESLKEMCDVASGMCSSVAQTYLSHILECFYSVNVSVRLTALSVIATILRQGLIHPIQTVANLISMQTDTDPQVRVKADAQLNEIDQKFPGFVNMRAAIGVSLSYRLQFMLYEQVTSDDFKLKHQQEQAAASAGNIPPETPSNNKVQKQPPNTRRSANRRTQNESESYDDGDFYPPTSELPVLQASYGAIRGSWNPEAEIPSALNSHLYSMLRGNRTQRRSFLNSLISLFDETNRLTLSRLVYIADNLAHFPYQVQEEPLYIIHHIDLLVSISGANVLQMVREALFPELKAALELAMQEQAQLEAKQRQESETKLKQELQHYQYAMNHALQIGDHQTAESHHESMQQVASKLQQISSMNSAVSGISGLRSAALVGRDAIDARIDLGPLEEEEEDELALIDRLQRAQESALPAMRDAMRTSRACVLLLMLKHYLKDVYGVTDTKIQKYSPSDSAKLWERPLTRRVGVKFHPEMCLSVAGQELRERLMKLNSEWQLLRQSDQWSNLMLSFHAGLDEVTPLINSGTILPSQLSAALLQNEYMANQNNQSFSKIVNDKYKFNDDVARWQDVKDGSTSENYEGEITNLAREYLGFRKLILTIDPQTEDDDTPMASTDGCSINNNVQQSKSLIVDSSLPGYLGDSNFTSIQPQQHMISNQQQQRRANNLFAFNPNRQIPFKIQTNRTLVPQSHNRETDEEDSEDSDAGGASRLMLAQSAPKSRSRSTKSGVYSRNAPKRKSAAVSRAKNLIALDDDSEEDNETDDSVEEISSDDEY